MSAPRVVEHPPVLLVGVDLRQRSFDAQLRELAQLALTAGLEPAARMTCKRSAPDAAFFVGRGKVAEIRERVRAEGIQEVLFDQALSPIQQRNLERELGLPVNDRVFLILEIFAQRARSHEGKLQVELARLQYLSTRLVRRWSHLERQHGGIGVRGGPGETQIELDRRMISQSIKHTRQRLEKVKRQQQTQRKRRLRNGVFRVALVGYTNAGKSTLFNALVKGDAYVADQLFATLDTTTRRLFLQPAGVGVSLSDTVGFIRDLPHTLVESFEATLQEAVDADLLLHVVDAAEPDLPEQLDEVQRVLKEIGADGVPQILVFNKLDLLPASRRPETAADFMTVQGQVLTRIFVSATTGEGLALLREEMSRRAGTNPDPRAGAATFGTIGADAIEMETHDRSH